MRYNGFRDLTFGEFVDTNFDELWRHFSNRFSLNENHEYAFWQNHGDWNEVCELLTVPIADALFATQRLYSPAYIRVKAQVIEPGEFSCGLSNWHCDGTNHTRKNENYSILCFGDAPSFGTEFLWEGIDWPGMESFNALSMKHLDDQIQHSAAGRYTSNVPYGQIVHYDNTFPHRGVRNNRDLDVRRIFIRMSNVKPAGKTPIWIK